MEQPTQNTALLDLMIQPGFTVRDHRIQRVNAAAARLLITPGEDVRDMLATGQEEYAAFTQGCLYLTVKLGSQVRGASLMALDGEQVFLLDPEPDSSHLCAYALAGQFMRNPLNTLVSVSGHIRQAAEGNTELQEDLGRMDRGLFQLMRMVNNMSDALLYTQRAHRELRDLTAFFDEIFEKAQGLLEHTGRQLRCQGLREQAYGMADCQQLERAVLNLLSNAVKFTPEGGVIQVSLARRDQTLRLTVADSGPGIADEILGNLFQRYLREPGIEDGRFGIGLGMILVRSAAVNHGGTVLVERHEEGTRITMTISLRRDADAQLRSPIFQVDYAGCFDHALMELSEVLPDSLYEEQI